MSSFWWGQSAFDEQVEKATSELLPAGQVDLALHLEISDQIRSKKITAKEAMRSFRQRLTHKNPNVIIATLSLIDTCVKNSGDTFVKEVATRDFMEEMSRLVKMPPGCNQDVKDKVLSLIQVWGIASKGNNSLSYISGTYNLLRAEGYVFPPVTEKIDSILLETAVAPDWTDSDVCERCRTAFTLTNRKHHCRQCGQTFCQQCSAKTMPLPHLGINEAVRVCDGCYIKLKLAKVADKDTVPHLLATPSSISSSLTPNYTPSLKKENADNTRQQPPTTVTDDQFEEDLKKAIELSKKESEQRKKFEEFITAPPVVKQKTIEEEEEEAAIAAAIAASLEDMKKPTTAVFNKDDISPVDMENIELFSTLMQRVRSSGNDVSGDTQINKLYVQIGTLQPKLVKTLNETSKKHDLFVELHNKLNSAVRAYDKLIEDRLAQRTQYPYMSQPPQVNNYPSYYPPTQTPRLQTPVLKQQPITYPVAHPYQPPQQQTPTQQHQADVYPQYPAQQYSSPQPYQPPTPITYQPTVQQQYQPPAQQSYQATSTQPYQQQSTMATQQQLYTSATTSSNAQQQEYYPNNTFSQPHQQNKQQIVEEAPLIEL